MKFRPVEAELFRADRRPRSQRDKHDDANIAFRTFANASI
jgi:hypothetical protein